MPGEFGTVVLVPFPFTDQTASKRRPAAIVSSRA
jgi:mRNA interferase MazF